MIKIKLIELVKAHKVNKKFYFYLSSIVIGVANTNCFLKKQNTLLKPLK